LRRRRPAQCPDLVSAWLTPARDDQFGHCAALTCGFALELRYDGLDVESRFHTKPISYRTAWHSRSVIDRSLALATTPGRTAYQKCGPAFASAPSASSAAGCSISCQSDPGGGCLDPTSLSPTMLTVLTVFWRALWNLITLVPVRPSRPKWTSMLSAEGMSAHDATGWRIPGGFLASLRVSA
jgi:hypothetical protein